MENTTKKDDQTKPKKPGRKEGWTAYPNDMKILTQVAREINSGQNNASARMLLIKHGGDNPSILRRLQRKWSECEDKIRRQVWREFRGRCQIDFNALLELSPGLYGRINSFAASPYGKTKLKEYSDSFGEPAHPMALGIMKLMKYVEQFEALQVKTDGERGYFHDKMAFHSAIESWLIGGKELTPDSLRKLADSCYTLANRLEQESKEKSALNKEGESCE